MTGIYVNVPVELSGSRRWLVPPAEGAGPVDPDAIRLVDALLTEIEVRASTHAGRGAVDSVYFGGGRPAALSLAQIGRILAALDEHFSLDPEAEVTFEVRPHDGTTTLLSGLRGLGVNRLSLGVESFFEEDLERIDAAHDAGQAGRIVSAAREAGFGNLSVDLMLGLPGQPLEYWGANLQRAARLGVEHVYLHEPDGDETPPDPDELADRYRMGVDLLRAEGYELYEISYFARPGFRSRHNRKYWAHENVLGLGPGAHSFFWRGGAQADRWANVDRPARYAALLEGRRLPVESRTRLPLFSLADEYVMFRLRTAEGLDLDVLETRYGVDLLTEKTDELAWLEADGLVEPIHNRIVRLTDVGRLVCDAVTRKLLR